MRKLYVLCILLTLPFLLFAKPLTVEQHASIMIMASSYGVPVSIADRMQIEESGDPKRNMWGDSEKVSKPGRDGFRSRGLFQISERWEEYLVSKYYSHKKEYFDWSNPFDSAEIALKYIADLHKRFGTWERALWFYNYGSVIDIPQSVRSYASRIINWPGPIASKAER